MGTLGVMVGYMASGKTTFCISELTHMTHINGDLYRTSKQIERIVENELYNRRSVVVDATNGTRRKREQYTQLANKYNCECICFCMRTSLEKALQNNIKRSETTDIRRIPNVAFYTYRKKYEEPSIDEDFTSIKKIEIDEDNSTFVIE